MQFVVDTMTKVLRTLNRRAQTIKAQYRAFNLFKTEVVYERIENFGLYIPLSLIKSTNLRTKKSALVIINSALDEQAQLYTGFHELPHVVCHHRINKILTCSTLECDFTEKQNVSNERRMEMEAHAIAAMCLIPVTDIQRVFNEELFYEPTNFEKQVCETRLSLWQNYYK